MAPAQDLRTAFEQALAAREALDAQPQVVPEATLAARVGEAADAWPQFTVPKEAFATDLGQRVRVDAEGGVDLDGLCVGDLYLAAGCRQGDPAAVEAFEERYAGEIESGFARAKLDADATAELGQRLRTRLFTEQDGAPPKIAAYSGYGELLHWLRVLVVRFRTDALRKQTRDRKRAGPSVSQIAGGGGPAAVASDDLEIDYLRRHYGEALREALEGALQGLSSRERNLLRLHGLEGLTSDQLGALYNVHPATARRWVAAAREAVLHNTREALQRKLSVGRDTFDSILRLARSELDVSVPRLLRPDDDDG